VFGWMAERAEKCGLGVQQQPAIYNAAAIMRIKSVTVTMRKAKRRRKGVNERRKCVVESSGSVSPNDRRVQRRQGQGWG
jgi:hypothetical protein